jgi:hypothetical protein
MWQTVIAFRRFADPLPSYEVMDYFVLHPEKRIDPGPCGVLFQRLHQIAWVWLGEGWFRDHQGFDIHIFHSPLQLLKSRLKHGWRTFVCAVAADRKSMQGLARADVDLVSHLFQQLDPHQQGYVRYALNGSLHT